MTEQNINTEGNFQTKKYVRGSFLYSTDDGTGYQQKNRNRVQDQILIQDKANLGSLKRQIQQKKQQLNKKKQKSKKQKQMLIPIRDTPVQPLPQPMMDNNKCQRATQQQFEYFQTYISLKQKQKKFEQDERKRIQIFQKKQQIYRKNQQNQERKCISIVAQKDEPISMMVNKIVSKKKPSIKIVIKKKVQQGNSQENRQQQKRNSFEFVGSHQVHAENNQKQPQINQFEEFQGTSKVRVIQENV